MSRRTFAGGKTPTGPACPPTGLTSRYPGLRTFLLFSLFFEILIILFKCFFFEEWTPEKKNKKGKKEVEKKGTIEKR